MCCARQDPSVTQVTSTAVDGVGEFNPFTVAALVSLTVSNPHPTNQQSFLSSSCHSTCTSTGSYSSVIMWIQNDPAAEIEILFETGMTFIQNLI